MDVSNITNLGAFAVLVASVWSVGKWLAARIDKYLDAAIESQREQQQEDRAELRTRLAAIDGRLAAIERTLVGRG